jgi:DNA polymerase-1
MELEGVRIDENFLKEYSDLLAQDIARFEAEVHELAGEKFNVDSPKQLGPILFEKLKVTTDMKRTKTGQYSTDEGTLSKYEHNHARCRHRSPFI